MATPSNNEPTSAKDSLRGKTLFITGSSRGIGRAIALRAALDGAQIAVVGKTSDPHPKLPGTVHTVVAEIEQRGGQGLPCVCDIRDDEALSQAVETTVRTFGGIDILINNASAIFLAGTADTPMKRFDLMHAVNVRATFMASQLCLPYLRQSSNAHILNNSPPLQMEPRWFAPHVAYTMSKYGMSQCVLGMAEEFREWGIAVNSLWPQTAIATSAIANVLGGTEALRHCRRPEIMADAAHAVVTRDARTCTGNFFIDEQVLRETGVTDWAAYAVSPGESLMPDFFV